MTDDTTAQHPVYEPREDSMLLAKWAAKLAKGNVLDMGTGSGYQALAARKSKRVKNVLCVDRNPAAVRAARQLGFAAVESDLFLSVKGVYDTIIFNPPYLPSGKNYPDMALDGGKRGYETLARFLRDLPAYLKTDGIALILFSSLTQKNVVDAVIDEMFLLALELDRAYIGGFETIYVYKISKTEFAKELERNGIRHIRRFTKGHRGIILTGMYKRRKVAIKIQRPDSPAKGTVDHEARVLSRLNAHGIGPRVLMAGKDYFVYPFIEGDSIKEYLSKTTKKYAQIMLGNVFKQMRTLDKLGHNKEEMHHPYKHIIVGDSGKITLLDFERCHATAKMHNVTQFCQCATSKAMEKMLAQLGIKIDKKKMVEVAKAYRKDMSEENFRKILGRVR